MLGYHLPLLDRDLAFTFIGTSSNPPAFNLQLNFGTNAPNLKHLIGLGGRAYNKGAIGQVGIRQPGTRASITLA